MNEGTVNDQVEFGSFFWRETFLSLRGARLVLGVKMCLAKQQNSAIQATAAHCIMPK